ncbi:condensation domain-containing protein, partial [Kibdelosporangium lantanae]
VRRLGLTKNLAAQGLWGLLLGSVTGRDDVVFGETVNGRPVDLAGSDRMVGLFINTLPVRVRWRNSDTIRDVLDRLQAQQTSLLDHQYLGLAEIQTLAGTGELFDTATVFENQPLPTSGSTDTTLEIADVEIHDGTHYPLALATASDAETLVFTIHHRPDIDVTALADRLLRLVEAFIADPTTPLARLSLLTAAERRLVVEAWNTT